MRIATYNIWNSKDGMPHRERHIVEEVEKNNADILCLQEVPDKKFAERILKESNYPFLYFENYMDSEEGLAILSKRPFERNISLLEHSNAIMGLFESNGKKVCVINIHLPWDSPMNRTKQIIAIDSFVDNEQCDYVILAGDFNCNETSDVNRFLLGECLLEGKETKRNWFDLAVSYAERNHTLPESTLNFMENPRFINNTIEVNSRFDRILLRNTYPMEFPVFQDCHVFGKKVYSETKLAASDHYGVSVDIEF
jgi:endonuclease/exonuclease/phosphatase family metal-dependent hydrolase